MTPAEAVENLTRLRAADPPTHGGRVLSYVYDAGRPDLDAVAAEAARLFQPVNGLDPTTFTSVAALERDLVRFARDVLHGDDDVVGSVTSGGTESCLLAVKTARDAWRTERGVGAGSVPRLVVPTTVHPAFRKAAHYLDLEVVEVPVDPAPGAVDPGRLLAAVSDDAPRTALVVVSAPSYPHGALDPVAEVAAGAAELGVACHVDACLGGWVLPWWPGDVPAWDLGVPGVTSLSADLHKFGYAPKGVSVLLHRTRERHRHQYYATTAWPGYPVVNPTVLGSRAAGSMAAAWAVVQVLGAGGLAELVGQAARATARLRAAVDALPGLRVVGEPTGPLLAVGTDESLPAAKRVDPFLWADAVRRRGWLLQCQPGTGQPDGTWLPRTAHLTITAVTERVAGELAAALVAGADEVRGLGPAQADPGLAASVVDGLPDDVAPVMATLEALPADVVEPLLVQVLQGVIDPDGPRKSAP